MQIQGCELVMGNGVRIYMEGVGEVKLICKGPGEDGRRWER